MQSNVCDLRMNEVVKCTAQRIAIAIAFASARSRTVWRVYAKFHIEMSEGGVREKREREK